MNIAIVTGTISGVVVVDADWAEAMRWCGHLPPTPWQTRTGRGGYHLWYRHPGDIVANKTKLRTREGKLAIDVRGDGGFVIAPGSIHASGAEYVEAGDWTVPVSEVPIFERAWIVAPTLPAPRPRQATPRFTSAGDVVARARAYLAAIPQPEIGHGSDAQTLYAACRLVRGFGLSEGDAEALMWEWVGGRAGWTPEWVAAKVANASRYGTESIGALL